MLEKAACGMYISGHPLDGLRWLSSLLHIAPLGTVESLPENTNVRTLCIVQSVRRHRTKNGEDMAFAVFEDDARTMEAVIFPKLFAASVTRLQKDRLLYVNARISRRDEETSLICESIRAQEEFPQMLRQMQLCIKLETPEDAFRVSQLPALCRDYPGETRIVLYHTARRAYASTKKPLFAEISEAFFAALCRVFPAVQVGLIPPVSR